MLDKISSFKKFVGRKVWSYFTISIFLGLAWFGVETFFVFVMQGFLFSIGLLSHSQTLLPEWYPVSLNSSVVMLIAFGFARASVSMLRVYFASLTQVEFVCDQRGELFKYGLKNASGISNNNLISTFTDVVNHSGLVMYFLSSLITTSISAILFFAMSLRLAPIETVIGVILLVVVLYPLKRFNNQINGYGNSIISEWENITGILLKGLKNYFLLKVYNRVDEEVRHCEESLKKYKNHYDKYSLILGLVSSAPMLIGVIILSLVTYVSVYTLKTESIKLISFFYLFIRLAQSASEMNGTLSHIRLHLPGFKELYRWRMRSNGLNDKIKLPIKTINSEEVTISLENVFFGYEQKNLLFNKLNFNIEKGDVLVIKGESGVGKSTLLSLILNLLKPVRGKVLINGLSTMDCEFDLSNVLGYVGPEPFLIPGSIRENLLYGKSNKNVTDEEISEMLKLVGLDQLVNDLPEKLNEYLSDLAQISTGQKQRLSLARALIRKPRLLVLDEATANLDFETEKKIINNLKKYFGNCTTIVVTHKNSFDEVATVCIDLNKKEEVL